MGSKKSVKAKIINIEPDPRAPGRTIVSIEFDDGAKAGPWIQAFSLTPMDRPVSVEELLQQLKTRGIERPVDPFAYLKQAKDSGKEYTVELDPGLVQKAGD